VLFYVVFVCKCVLPPGDNLIAVNKYISKFWRNLIDPSAGQKRRCNAGSSDILVAAYQITQNDIPDKDSNLDNTFS
jgi:hypothetical protein